jgi:transposase
MIAVTAQTRIWVAVEPADFRCGIDGLARVCRQKLKADPFSGALFVFRNRRSTSVKILAYNGIAFWLCQERLSKGRFRWWPKTGDEALRLEAHQLQLLLAGGDPAAAKGMPVWRELAPAV